MKIILEIIGGTLAAALILFMWVLVKATGIASREEEQWQNEKERHYEEQ
jgi:hypothetical protein